MDLIERLRNARKGSQQRVLGSDIFEEAADTIDRLLQFTAESGVAYRDDDHDMIVEGFRTLPDDIQAEINRREEAIDARFEHE